MGGHPSPLAGGELVAFLATADPTRARAFYEQVLGLDLVEETALACVFRAGRTTLRVAIVGEVVPAPQTVLGWTVDDLDAAVAALAERGVEFVRYGGLEQDARGVWTAPGGARVAWFRDPDANTLSLTQHPGTGSPPSARPG